MTGGPVLQILGIPDWADAYQLLDLSPEETSPAAIERALQRQLAKTHRHPDSRSARAEFVRQQLRRAAAILRDPKRQAAARGEPLTPDAPRQPAGNGAVSAGDLTEFDRHVLAVLIAYGGWNADSRAKLVSVAAMHNVSPAGLLKVITGLSGYARRGGGRFEVSNITRGSDRFDALPPAPTPNQPETWTQVMIPEIAEGGFWATVKLSVLFGSIALLLGVMFVNLLFSEPDQPGPSLIEQVERPVLPITTEKLPDPEKIDRVDRPALASWPETPTFQGAAVPREVIDAADQAPRLPDDLDRIVRQLTVNRAPSLATKQDWRVLTRLAATAWLRVDETIDRAIRDEMIEALFAVADRPTVADDLLDILAESARAPIAPIDQARGAWITGMLGELAARQDLPPSVSQHAASLVRSLVDDAGGSTPSGFAESARAWLAGQRDDHVRITSYSPDAFDHWEMWLAAHRRIGTGTAYQAALIDAVRELMELDADLGSLNPVTRVLGRLVFLLDLEQSDPVRDRVLALYQNPSVSTRDLWAFGSLLVQSGAMPWFDHSLVVPVDATNEERLRRLSALREKWPKTAVAQGRSGATLSVNPAIAKEWLAMAQEAMSRVERETSSNRLDAERWVVPLAHFAAMNHAALAIAKRNNDRANEAMQRALDALQQLGAEGGSDVSSPLLNPPNRPQGPIPRRPTLPINPGGPIPSGGGGGGGGMGGGENTLPGYTGIDGEWTQQYEGARSSEQRLMLMQSLRTNASGDLGPIDAMTFVRIVYSGGPAEIRALAHTTLVELFSRGKNVAIAMLDYFPDAAPSQSTSDIISQYTGSILPGVRSDSWRMETRRALAQHTLRLYDPTRSRLDRAAATLALIYRLHWLLVSEASAPADDPSQPTVELQRLLDAWRTVARSKIIMSGSFDSLADIERRHATRERLADGSLANYVSMQITLLELIAYASVADQPALAGPVQNLLRQSAQRRREAKHILEQATIVERTITELWMLRFQPTLLGPGGTGGES